MKMSILGLRCAGKRCNPPAVVPPLWLAFVISKFVRAAARSFSANNAGYACLELKPKPADKLSPRTRIRFTAEESRGAAGLDGAARPNEMPARSVAVPDCFSDF